MKSILALFAVQFFLFTALFPAAIFVSPTGDDTTGTGSITQPYLTLKKASYQASPGDTIYLRGGTYYCTDINSRHEITGTDGTAQHPIVVRPYRTETVILDGDGYSLSSNDGLLRINVDYYIVDSLIVRNSSERGIHFSGSHHLTIRHCTVYNIQQRAIGGSGEYITIENCEVYNSALANENASMMPGGWPGVIQTIKVWGSGESSRHITIRNNHVHDCWGESILISHTEDAVVEGNRIENGFSVYVYITKSQNVVIRNNYIFATDPTYNRPDKNYPATGILLANENNSTSSFPAIDSIVVYNNIIAGCGKGFSYWQDGSNTNPLNSYARVWFYHNVIADPVKRAIHFYEVGSGYNQPHDCAMKNNIIEMGEELSEMANLAAWTFSHNNWVDSIPDFAAEPNSFRGNPQFQSPGVGGDPTGYRIQAHSPCLAAGTPLSGVSTDYWGTQRHPSHPCVGAHEYPALTLELHAFLEGPYHAAGDSMYCTPADQGGLPSAQPYDASPWNYHGAETAQPMPEEVVDWVLVGLRTAPQDSASEIRRAALLLTDGSVVGTSGTAPVAFPDASEGSYSITLYHRNHLPVCSASTVNLSHQTTGNYNFSDALAKAYTTGPPAMKQLNAGVWGLLAGDGNSDGAVDAIDLNNVWLNQQGSTWDYSKKGDFNLDGVINSSDRNNYWEPNNGSGQQFP